METLFQDLRFGFRRLLKSPGFTFAALISLALGVGANAAIFSLVSTVMLRPLPVPEPENVISVSVTGKNDAMLAFSYPNYMDYRDRNDVFSGLLVYRISPMSLSREGNNERIWGYMVSGNYFDVLGVQAVEGRTFLPEEDRTRNSHPVAVISHTCWQSRFGADPQIVGKEILINGNKFNVVGVAPEGFKGTEFIYTPEVWVPIMMVDRIEPGSRWLESRETQNMFAVGRLKPGVSIKQAESSLNILAEQLGREYPDANEGQIITLIAPGLIVPALRGAVVSFALVLMIAVGLVLLIACVNLASLLLARATERRKEIAIRIALGAKRFRLVRQLLTESLLLSVIGGAAGLLLAFWIIDLIVAFRPPVDFPLTIDLRMDWRVIAFSLAVSLATGVVFGLVPALQATKPNLVSALKDTTSQAGFRRSKLRSSLVVAQIALSLVLLIAAGLVVRALMSQTMNPGFQTENGLTMSVDLGLQGYDETRGRQFQRQLIERVESLPGIESATTTNFIPLSLNYSSNYVYVEGQPPERGANTPLSMVSSVGLSYFGTMGIPLLSGRDFSERDQKDAPKVGIINETFARRFFPGNNPTEAAIGKRISFKSLEGPFLKIIGVVKDGKYFNISEEPRPFIYISMSQYYEPTTILIARTASDPRAMISAIRSEAQKLDANLPVYDTKTLTEHMRLSLFPARIAAATLGSFGLLALALAAVGIYGVTSYTVAQRTREVGIRMALGAQSGDVLRMMIKQGMILILIGVAIGLTAALFVTGLMSSLLFGVSSTDPLTFITITLILSAVALGACAVPARRATKVDPMIALRYE